jgi:hypothetical protein
MELKIHPESDLLNVVATGTFSLEEAKRTFLQMLEASARHNSKKLLFDGRELIGEPGFMERFYYGEFAARTVTDFLLRQVPAATRFAYVLREPVRDPERFGETVALNRGMDVKTFQSPEEALNWLGIAPTNKPESGNGEGPT